MSLLDRDEVPAPKSRASTRPTDSPRVAASSATPAPTTPPPTTSTWNSAPASAASAADLESGSSLTASAPPAPTGRTLVVMTGSMPVYLYVLRRRVSGWFVGGGWCTRWALMPLRWYHGTFTLEGRRLRIPAARGRPPLWVRLDRDLPYPPEQVRSVTLLYGTGRLWVDVTAEVPVACYPAGQEPDPGRVAGVDLGIIHPYAVAGPGREGLLMSGRAIRAEHRMHLADTKARQRAVARRAPKPGQKGSRRWRHYQRRQRLAGARHRRRVRQAQHEAATTVIAWAVTRRIGALAVGDPRGVLNVQAGRR